MEQQEIRDYLKKELAELLFVDEEEILGNMSLTEELGADSLEMQELYMKVSEAFQIQLNLIRIVNDTALALEQEKDSSPEKQMEKIQDCMKVEFTEENKEDFSRKAGTESPGRLLKLLQGYITVDMLAAAICKLKEKGQ